jgi:hypothetical protein
VLTRRALQGACALAFGLAVSVGSVATASASTHKSNHHKSSHHSTTTTTPKRVNGANPTSVLCKSLNGETSDSVKIETAFTKAFASKDFAASKKAMLAAVNLGVKEEGPALRAMQSAAANVQTAIKGLFTFDSTLKADIEKSTSITTLEASLTSLGQNTALTADSTTVTNYITTQCGTLPTTTL